MKVRARKLDLTKTYAPKSIYPVEKRFEVGFHSKKLNRTIYAGSKRTLKQALALRDEFVKEHAQDALQDYRPRGISKSNNGFQVKLNFENNEVYLGFSISLTDAIKMREQFIDSLLADKGVSVANGKYQAVLKIGDVVFNLGYFDTFIDADSRRRKYLEGLR